MYVTSGRMVPYSCKVPSSQKSHTY
jgi:hypothetical protein